MVRIHRYEGEEIIVEFDLSRCIHVGDCTDSLPDVFNTRRSGRWVHPDAAAASEVAQVCANCPTGALHCIRKADGQAMDTAPAENTVRIVADGPLYVHAKMTVNGEPEPGFRAAFCRCGKSRLMPYCDQSHREAGFHDTGHVLVPMPGACKTGQTLSITTISNGPLMLEGPFTLIDGTEDTVCRSGKAAMCRCGASKMKPYCDGSHKNIHFE